jgi:hypothetical protein
MFAPFVPNLCRPADQNKMTKLKEKVDIRAVIDTDAEALAEIYNHYVTRTIITFEEDVVSSAEICQRIREARAFYRSGFQVQPVD